ncbi:Gfo/Idh/MocA family oxidoreductase [Terrihabitans rhizophilus]|uniref:Gfo/Idh/MocA family oxidoreductase n=1 Tax=Terrihabitans rhizophilus TaxID=3092662 RepID=A0ABU4RR22_9HYPH|nr:Gfo/Idh/MocA family oxidoreductase [Terrihabitans sp. PJ23]MDX6807284.1 Gfo/Idh/MocA family oxidoreductase [Terrihabitans sp. PJ23]
MAATRPRLGFLGTGWIGRHRMEAMLATGTVDAVAVADTSADMVVEALKLAPHAQVVSSLDEMLALGLDGVVIATPSAMHAEQSIAALRAGAAVFCQKPLGRDAGEAQAVVEAARAADRLLGVDFSYRYTAGMQRIRDLLRGGELGRIYAVDLVFHNAYGPDKAWFYDPAQSGGGCVMDLGVHLVDLALWALDFPTVSHAKGTLFAGGEPLAGAGRVEDYALATLQLDTGAAVQLACSWRLQAGCDAVISAAFYGTEGGAALRNVDGSFYDFVAERYRGTSRETLATPPDQWGGRAGADWAMRLAGGECFDLEAERLVTVSRTLDTIYGR